MQLESMGMLFEARLHELIPLSHVVNAILVCIASMSVTGLEDVYITEENFNGRSFVEYVRHSLQPMLMPFNGINPKSVVIMDNTSIHHIDEVISAIEYRSNWCNC